MGENNSGAGFNLGAKAPDTGNIKQSDAGNLPVEDVHSITSIANDVEEEDPKVLDKPYTHRSSITIALVNNYSLYRKANDKVLPKKTDYIGSSFSGSRVLSSNDAEVRAYFPKIIGLAPTHDDFTTRVKGWLNNIRVPVDGLGRSFDTSFVYNKKSDFYAVQKQEQEIEETYLRSNRQDLKKLKEALANKINAINDLEATKHFMGSPVNIEEYLLYRHCLLYKDIAKDVAIINSDVNVRFYFKDDQKEAERLRKHRTEINKALKGYVNVLSDFHTFDTVYAQYALIKGEPIVAALLEDRILREDKLQKFATEDPIKFNKMVGDRDLSIKYLIERLIGHNILSRSSFNQNISTADGVFIGANIGEAVAWFQSPDNATVVGHYRSQLEHI